jgi:hypothetical protein
MVGWQTMAVLEVLEKENLLEKMTLIRSIF